MGASLRTEYRKLVTTRLWWVLLATMVAYMAVVAAGLAWALSQAVGSTDGGVVLTPQSVVSSVYTVGVSLGYVFPLVVGALGMTTEFRHRTITPTLLVEPRRSVVLGAKLAAGGVLGVLFGLAGTAAAAGAGGLVLHLLGRPTMLGTAATWGVLGRSVLALALWAVVGTGVGVVLTNQVAAVVVLLAFTQFVEPIARTVLALTSWGTGVAKFLPGAAGEAISGGSVYAASGMSDLLPWGWGVLLLAGYGLVLALVGRLTTLRHDIT